MAGNGARRACLFEPGTPGRLIGTLAGCYDAVCRLGRWLTSFEDGPSADMMTIEHAGGLTSVAHWQRLRDADADGAWHDRAEYSRS